MSTWNEEEDGMGFSGLLPSAAEKRAEREEAFRRARETEKLNMAYAEGRKDEREEWLPLLAAARLVIEWYEAEDDHSKADFYQRMEMCRTSESALRAAIASVEGKS